MTPPVTRIHYSLPTMKKRSKDSAKNKKTIKSVEMIPKDSSWAIPEFSIESDPLSLIALESIRLDLECLRLKLTSSMSYKKKISLFEDFYEMNLVFESALKKFEKDHNDCPKKKKDFLNKIVLKLEGEIKQIREKLLLANKLHSSKFKIYQDDLTQIDRDIFVRAIEGNGWLGDFETLRRGSRNFDIEDISKTLIPIHSTTKTYEHLQPGSPLFARAFLDVDWSTHSAWEKQKITWINSLVPNSLSQPIKKNYEEYAPTEKLDDVILPENVKRHISSLCAHYQSKHTNSKSKKLTFLFKGPPGTGKTMTAKAIANELGLKVLQVQFPKMGEAETPRAIAFFAERAKHGKYLLLFDECEDLVWYNPFVGQSDSWVKQFFEKFSGVAVFTTNYQLDDAFKRRITYSTDFKNPDSKTRSVILKNEIQKLRHTHELTSFPSESTIQEIASRHPVSGGYYEQVLQLATAQSRLGTIEETALIESFAHCETQQFLEADSIREPSVSLSKVQLPKENSEEIKNFIEYSKTIFKSKQKNPLMPQGATALFSGPPGTGKTLTAEAIASELSLPFRRVSPSTFLSKWIGETENKIKQIFREAARDRHVLFIDEAEGLFLDRQSATKSWEKTQADELLNQVESFPGILIIATNFKEMMDQAFARRFLFHVNFKMPDAPTRRELWNTWKESLNLSESTIDDLSQRFELTGGEIRNVAVRSKVTQKTSVPALSILCADVIRGRTGNQSRRIGL